eukprot:Seg2176.9 transcript_id=Seg2176.9/GoldUCD/mRNA.D3Y31 product="hypothetical protein" protein_id=Seg2176.9/GoldUCD/D3Y31
MLNYKSSYSGFLKANTSRKGRRKGARRQQEDMPVWFRVLAYGSGRCIAVINVYAYVPSMENDSTLDRINTLVLLPVVKGGKESYLKKSRFQSFNACMANDGRIPSRKPP